jgi:hypothetical protein
MDACFPLRNLSSVGCGSSNLGYAHQFCNVDLANTLIDEETKSRKSQLAGREQRQGFLNLWFQLPIINYGLKLLNGKFQNNAEVLNNFYYSILL